VSADVALSPDTVSELGLKDTVGPEGETDPVKFTVPEKPLTLLIVIVVIPVPPWAIFREVGFEVMLKSMEGGGLIVTETVAVRCVVPLLPVTVIL
jgi:hypothetical protein